MAAAAGRSDRVASLHGFQPVMHPLHVFYQIFVAAVEGDECDPAVPLVVQHLKSGQ